MMEDTTPAEAVTITPMLRDLIVMFLEDLERRMTNSICNDFEWPNHMTEEDIAQMWSIVHDHWTDDFPLEPDPPKITNDWLVVFSIVKELGG